MSGECFDTLSEPRSEQAGAGLPRPLTDTDPGLPHKNAHRSEQWEDDIESQIKDQLCEAGVDDELDDLEAWELIVQDLLVETELPIATVPEGEAALPDDPIYDSGRSYAENKARIDRYQASE